MSVINKMLRDLDARRSQAPQAMPQLQPQLLQGTASVGAAASTRRRLWLAVGLAALALTLGLAAWWASRQASAPAAVAIVPPVPAPTPAAPAVAGSAEPAPPQPAAAPPSEPPPALRAVMEAAAAADARRSRSGSGAARAVEPKAAEPQAPESKAAKTKVTAEARATSSPSTPAAAPPRRQAAAAEPAPAATATSVAATAASAAAPAAAAPPARAATAVQEAVTQAQALWAGGAREAAVELLREALAAAERAAVSDGELQTLLRELARMELAQGRPGLVLDLLGRLEPRWSGQADLWALRGNAAQRLGRHAEAAQSYERALQLRPAEPRWLLASAVSLAALGQLEAAGRQLAQARALAPVHPEVLNYLRQAGVSAP